MVQISFNELLMKISEIRWKASLALIAVWIAIYFNWNWVWGIIFLFWVIPEIKHGVAHFIEEVERSRNPITYWLIISSWILLSLYLLITAISPKLNPESAMFFGYKDNNQIISKSLGVYDKDKNDSISIKDTINIKRKKADDTLKYKVQNTKEMMFAGVSMQTSFSENRYLKDINELWDYFNKNDISSIILNKKSWNVYVIYSDYNIPEDKNFTVTIGYQVNDLEDLHKDLASAVVPSTKFATFVSKEKNYKALQKVWDKVLKSDLPRTNTHDIEMYQLNNKTFDLEKSELWISIK